MRFNEFKPLRPFRAQVRLKTDKTLVLTVIWADGQQAARRNLAQLYGTGNVLTVSEITLTEAKQLTAQDQQIKALKNKAKQITQQAQLAKQITQQAQLKKAQQAVSKAQQQLTQATAPAPASNQP